MEDELAVHVVDDDDAVRRSLRWLLESVGLRVETYGSGQEFLDGFEPRAPGCVVLDLRMPELGGFEILDAIAKREPRLPVIVITGYADVPATVRAMQAGAAEFFEKPVNDQVLLDRVQHWLHVSGEEWRASAKRKSVEEKLDCLSRREREVLDLLLEGLTNKAIARELNVSPKAIEVYRKNLMKKLTCDNVVALCRLLFSCPMKGYRLLNPPAACLYPGPRPRPLTPTERAARRSGRAGPPVGRGGFGAVGENAGAASGTSEGSLAKRP